MNGESPLASAKNSSRTNTTSMRLTGTIHHSFSCQIKLPSDRPDSLMILSPVESSFFCGHHPVNLHRDDLLRLFVRVRIPRCYPQALWVVACKCILEIQSRNAMPRGDTGDE